MVLALSDLSPSQIMWEERFSADTYVYGTEPNEFLRASLAMLAPGTALCLAEGEGRNAVFLAQCGYEVSSVDLSRAGVRKTERLAAERGVTVSTAVGDLAEFDIGVEKWDLVVSVFAHLPAPVRRELHQRVVAALKPGGFFLLEAYTPDQLAHGTGGPSSADLMMTLAELREELVPLDFIHSVEVERDIFEGSGHKGRGAVVQIIARKEERHS